MKELDTHAIMVLLDFLASLQGEVFHKDEGPWKMRVACSDFETGDICGEATANVDADLNGLLDNLFSAVIGSTDVQLDRDQFGAIRVCMFNEHYSMNSLVPGVHDAIKVVLERDARSEQTAPARRALYDWNAEGRVAEKRALQLVKMADMIMRDHLATNDTTDLLNDTLRDILTKFSRDFALCCPPFDA